MPYPTTLWDFINRAMPPWPYEKGASPDRTLTPDNVYALTAFLLYKNGIIKETDVMDKRLVEVPPNRRRILPDPPHHADEFLVAPFGIVNPGGRFREMTRP